MVTDARSRREGRRRARRWARGRDRVRNKLKEPLQNSARDKLLFGGFFFLVVDFLVASSAALGSITWGGLGIALLWSEYRVVLICSLYGVLWNKGVVYL